MTTPGGSAPDGAYTLGEMQQLDEQGVKDATTKTTRDKWQGAQDSWRLACKEVRNTPADITDGQRAYNHRLDLLDGVAGYASAVASKNWNIPERQWIRIPFDTQVGPVKDAGIEATEDGLRGCLVIKKSGLWRIDANMTVSGSAISVTYYWNGTIMIPLTTYQANMPSLMIEVVAPNGTLLGARKFDLVADLTNYPGLDLTTAGMRSGGFNLTTVIDGVNPADPATWVRVYLSAYYEARYTGTLNQSSCKMWGGTKMSSLIATCWSRETDHAAYTENAPDGGNLG